MSSSTSSGTIWVLFHVDWYLGCTGTGGGKRLSASAWDFSLEGVAPLLLRREKRGIVARRVLHRPACARGAIQIRCRRWRVVAKTLIGEVAGMRSPSRSTGGSVGTWRREERRCVVWYGRQRCRRKNERPFHARWQQVCASVWCSLHGIRTRKGRRIR